MDECIFWAQTSVYITTLYTYQKKIKKYTDYDYGHGLITTKTKYVGNITTKFVGRNTTLLAHKEHVNSNHF